MTSHTEIFVTPENKHRTLRNTPLPFKILANAALRITFGRAEFIHTDGRRFIFDSGNHSTEVAVIHINNYAFVRRTLLGGTIGFYESFEDGDWETPDLSETLYVFATNAEALQSVFLAHPLLRLLNNSFHAFNKNTKPGSKRNIIAHYDLGNDFYKNWLGPSMTYSSALYKDGETDLTAAQLEKYRTLANQLQLEPEQTVLEIGCGWGGFAEIAAKEYGAHVTGLTLSPEQLRFAQRRVFEQGLNEKIDLRLQDYRDIDTKFDKVVSIEMFEAVGQKYWHTYFQKVYESLRHGGLAGFQIITITDNFFQNYANSADFIQRYIFPGGMLPSPSLLSSHLQKAGLQEHHKFSFGADYARTLAHWHASFIHAWEDISQLGFDDRFKKLWRFYLAYCEAGFRAQSTDVCQLTAMRV